MFAGPVRWNKVSRGHMDVTGSTVEIVSGVPDALVCHEECLGLPGCKSVEYDTSSQECHLKSITRLEAWNQWQSDTNYEYYDYFYSNKGMYTKRSRHLPSRLIGDTLYHTGIL